MGEEELYLSSTYPRRELTEDMDDGTLTQLGLVSAIIVVRFKRVRVLFFTIIFHVLLFYYLSVFYNTMVYTLAHVLKVL